MVTDIPETRESLLIRVKDPDDRDAWEQFTRIYRPVIYRLARGRGMQDADAQDLSQQVLMSIASAVPRWQRQNEQTRFRHWLRRVARNAIFNALSRQPADRGGGSAAMDLLLECPDRDEATQQAIETEYRRELYLQAAQIVRRDVKPETWRAFEMTVVECQSVESTARQIGRSVGVVYAARSRIMRRLREAVVQLEREEP